MSSSLVISLFILIPVFLLLSLFLLEFRFLLIRKNYRQIVYKKLYNYAEESDQLLTNDVHLVFSGDELKVIDHIFIADKYIYIIKDVYYDGMIYGNINDQYLFNVNNKGKTEKIKNILIDNGQTVNDLILALNLSSQDNVFVNVVCFNSNLILPSEMKIKKQGVFFISANELIPTIKQAEKDNIPSIPHQKSEKLINFLATKSNDIKKQEKILKRSK